MLDRQAKADRRAIVEDVERELLEAEHFGEPVDHVGDVLEGVGELVPRRLLGHPEARQIGRHDMIVVGEFRDQVSEHVARAREAVEQQNGRASLVAGLAIEHLEAVYIDEVENERT